jgi:hypothetical protein
MTQQQPVDNPNSLGVGPVSRRLGNGETTFQIGPHYPSGFNAIVVWNLLLLVGSLALVCFGLFRQPPESGPDFMIAAVLLGLFLFGSLALVLDAIWWRRVCLDGTEVVVLRGNLLIHRAMAFGYVREWVRRLDKVRRVKWIRAQGNRYVSTVTLWARFPNMFVVGWGLDPESGEWLTAELDAAARRLRGDSRPN